jgi:hypothetical protein
MPQPLSTPPEGMPQSVIDFRTRTIMPDTYVDALWDRRPGYLEAVVAGAYADIYGRLRKRYVVPFATVPEAVVRWMTRIVTAEAYRARGIDASDDQIELIDADRVRAYEEIKEAADGAAGLFDLPLDPALDVTAIAKGGPLGYSETSPYAWTDVQSDRLRGGGT